MTKNLSRRIFLLSLLYISIIFGIFALQFTNGSSFSLSLGLLRVSGSTEKGPSGAVRPGLPLHVGVNGVDFLIDSQNPLLAYTSDTASEPLKIVSISGPENPSTFTIKFTGDVSVSFASEKRGEADIVTITANLPVKYQKIAFPYKITHSARAEKKDSLMLISVGKRQYVFNGTEVKLPVGSSVQPLLISRASPVVHYQTWLPAKGFSPDEVASLPGASATVWNAAVEHYAALALESFKASVASGSLSEPLVSAYIAEMGRVGMYHAALDAIPESYRSGGSRTWKTCTFLDNLERTYPGLIIKEKDDRTDLSHKFSENDPACFEFPSLVPYLIDRGSSVLLKDLARVATNLDMTKVSALQAAGILDAMMDYDIYVPGSDNTLLSLSDSCERKLKSSLFRVHDQLYVSDDGKTVDTLATLRIAQILIRYGSRTGGNDVWKMVGNLLGSSIVSQCGSDAVFPASLALEGSDPAGSATGVTANAGKGLDPAVSYPLVVTGNTWYPHALSLATQAGPGVWAWTSAQSITVTKPASNEMKITTRFPQGETHYMVLRGIKPFTRIQIYGMDFHTDPQFEIYNSSGYRYNETTGTLYLKMRHKSEYEDVVIWFGSAAPAAPAPAAESDKPAEPVAQ
jgi:hypothetical protein